MNTNVIATDYMDNKLASYCVTLINHLAGQLANYCFYKNFIMLISIHSLLYIRQYLLLCSYAITTQNKIDSDFDLGVWR